MKQRAVVVGSGIAGLIAALELSEGFDVTLVTKALLADSNTRWAQGGIAAVMFDDDNVADHVSDTLRAGAGLCDRAAVEVLCHEGPERIRELIALGVAFDRRGDQLARGLEAAHSRPRVLHAGGDATGLNIELALGKAVRAANVRVHEHTFACDVVSHEGCVSGLEVLGADGRRIMLPADVVLLASGGAGQLYQYTTNPLVATGDGVAIALRAGAELDDVEFYQFHPTMLATPGTFLVSEAVRGEGAVLLDLHGKRFMPALHVDAELAPRDVVARGIAMQMAAQGNRPVLLDATGLGARFLRERFPSIDAACRAQGLDWAHQPIPVTPAAHYWMGGVRTDLQGRTSIPGLYAVGEVACTGVHGANRLASNSLLESLVFAFRCTQSLLEGKLSKEGSEGDRRRELSRAEGAADEYTLATASPVGRTALQALMWRAAGIERTADAMYAAVETLRGWRAEDGTVEQLETANLLTCARVLLQAALAREESRGAHFRTDFPETSPSFARSLSLHSTAECRQMQEAYR